MAIEYGVACGNEQVRIIKDPLGGKGRKVTHKCNRPKGHSMKPLGHVQYNTRDATKIDQWR